MSRNVRFYKENYTAAESERELKSLSEDSADQVSNSELDDEQSSILLPSVEALISTSSASLESKITSESIKSESIMSKSIMSEPRRFNQVATQNSKHRRDHVLRRHLESASLMIECVDNELKSFSEAKDRPDAKV